MATANPTPSTIEQVLSRLITQQNETQKATQRLVENVMKVITKNRSTNASSSPNGLNKEQLMDILSKQIQEFVHAPEEDHTFETWYTRYQGIFEEDANKLGDADKTRLLLRNVSSAVYQQYAHIILPGKPNEIDFKTTVNKLTSMFGEKQSLFSTRYKCFQIVKNDLEDYTTYIARVNRQCEKFKLKKCTSDNLKCLIFVNGLQATKDSVFRNEILKMLDEEKPSTPVTLDVINAEIQRILQRQKDNQMIGMLDATNNTEPPASTAVSQFSAFTFGAVGAQASTPAFGGGNTIVSPPAFGVPKATASTTPFAFGGGATANKPSATSAMGAPSTGGFSFGASNNTNPLAATNNATSTNIFGAAASTLANNSAIAVPSNTNIVKPTYNFGGGTAANTNTNTNDAANKSIFVGAAANTNTNNNPFGAFATAAAASNNQANTTFSFNTNTSSHNNNATTNNPFAAAASKPAAGGFSFNTNTTNNKPAAAPTPSAPFAFGATANNAAAPAASTTAFSFGGNTNNSSGAPPNKTFTFGSSVSNNSASASTMNARSIFGGSVTQTANSTQQASVSPFSFSSANTVVAARAPAAGNIFAPPPAPGTGASGERRKIRHATRRLQKT